MALTTCPECSGTVSDAAQTCPHCGFPLPNIQQVAPGTPSDTPAPSEPGWYSDPSGNAAHQAYWDGDKWTGATRPGPSGPVSLPPKRRVPTWLWILGALVVVAAILTMQNDGRDDTLRTFGEIAAGLEGSTSDSDGSFPSRANDRVSLEGQGDGDSRTFNLSGGSYTVSTDVGGDCFYGFTLRDPADSSRVKSVTSMDEAGSSTVSVHGVEAGTYYVGVITGPAPSCPWSQVWASS